MSQLPKNQETCSVCDAEPEDMLILSCRHNLCLDCATEVYHLNFKQDKIVCEICLSQTRLDEDTIVCLRSLSAKNMQQSAVTTSKYQNSPSLSNRQIHPPMPRAIPHYPREELALIQQQSLTPLCQKHNEPLMYYCLECKVYKICSECMLLDNHRYHKVVTLKKAAFQVKDIIEKVGREKQKLRNLLQKDLQNLSIRKEQSQKQLQTNLAQVKQVFDEISAIIAKKLAQVSESMQQEANRKLEIMEGAINEIQQKITLIDETIEFQDQLLRQATCSEGKQQNSIFRMFHYYESEMDQHKVNFEPSLPNFIAQVNQEQLIHKDKVFTQIEQILDQLRISAKQTYEEASQENINYISQIQNENICINNQPNIQIHNKIQQYELKPQAKPETIFMPKQRISQNINIIQFNNNGNRSEFVGKNAKKSKQSIEAIKQKARQNLKDRELSHSRKMQLSRSIENATDILNKIQKRTLKA